MSTSCLRGADSPTGRHLLSLQYVVPGGHVRCSIRMGNWIPIITTTIIVIIALLTTSTIHRTVVDLLGIADILPQVKARTRAWCIARISAYQWLHPGRMPTRIETLTLILSTNPVLLSTATAVMATRTLDSDGGSKW